MAVRLYTHGYDLYVPPVSVCYHLWDRGTRKTIHRTEKEGEGMSEEAVSLPKWKQERKDSQSIVIDQVRGLGK
eukprot:1011726-Ditylum_brightwellii.AAC.1